MIMTIDIGGTKTLCAWWDKEQLIKKELYPTSSIKNYIPFVKEHTRGLSIDALCFAMAGPIVGNRLELTNTGQTILLDQLKSCVSHIPHVLFLNDLQALGHALPRLKPDQLRVFQAGSAGHTGAGAKAILSIGTGLGISAVTKEGLVLPSEGGHADFAPRDPKQLRVLEYLKDKYGHVSYERVLSGQGLADLYEALSGSAPEAPEQVTAGALDGDPKALETFRLFTRVLAAACGNTALTFMASGGIYLGGGIMPKILPLLDRSVFEKAFLDKGRFSRWLCQVPVYVILDEMAPSIGAAARGQSAAGI